MLMIYRHKLSCLFSFTIFCSKYFESSLPSVDLISENKTIFFVNYVVPRWGTFPHNETFSTDILPRWGRDS